MLHDADSRCWRGQAARDRADADIRRCLLLIRAARPESWLRPRYGGRLGSRTVSSPSLLPELKPAKILCKLVRCGLNRNEIRAAALLPSVN